MAFSVSFLNPPLNIPTPTPAPYLGGPVACLAGPVACLDGFHFPDIEVRRFGTCNFVPSSLNSLFEIVAFYIFKQNSARFPPKTHTYEILENLKNSKPRKETKQTWSDPTRGSVNAKELSSRWSICFKTDASFPSTRWFIF